MHDREGDECDRYQGDNQPDDERHNPAGQPLACEVGGTRRRRLVLVDLRAGAILPVAVRERGAARRRIGDSVVGLPLGERLRACLRAGLSRLIAGEVHDACPDHDRLVDQRLSLVVVVDRVRGP